MRWTGRRVLFTIRGCRFHSYPVMLYFGLLTGIVAGDVAAHRAGIDPLRVFVATLVLIPFALLGARLMHVALHWKLYMARPADSLRCRQGGADMFGGFPVVMLLSVPVLPWLGLTFWQFWDVATFTLFVGMFVARFGCLLNGCCAGRPTRAWWGIEMPNAQGVVCRRVPMQLLEAAWTLLVLVIAVSLQARLSVDGVLFCIAVAVYSLGRFLLDPWREESHRRWGLLTVHQGIYATVLVMAIAWLLWNC